MRSPLREERALRRRIDTAFARIDGWTKNPRTITIKQVTAFPDSGSHPMILANPEGNEPIYSLVFINILILRGLSPVSHADSGTGNCVESRRRITSVCFPTYLPSVTTA